MNGKFKIRVLAGVPGSGKSYRLRSEAEWNGGRYLFAYPSLALLEEQAAALRKEAKLRVIEVHLESKGKGTVEDKLKRAFAEVTSQDHSDVAILITHASLMSCDLSDFVGWHFCIDEAPTAVQSGKINTAVSALLFEAHFSLDKVGNGPWHEVKLKKEAPRWRTIQADDLTKSVSEFFKHAGRNVSAFVDVDSWGVKQFNWCAIWSPQVLERIAKSVTIAGASYPKSLGGQLALRWCEIDLIDQCDKRVVQPTISINYFTEKHKGSSSFWSRSEGRKRIVPLCEYMSSQVKDLGYWSANEPVKILMEHRLAGEMISAKSAGLNTYDEATKCAFIYSSKATPADEPIKAALGFTDEDILRAREQEDILQFVMRGAIRRPDYAGPYDVYLYSRDQAETLELMLRQNGFDRIVLTSIEEAGLINDAGPDTNKEPKKPAKVVSQRTGKTIKSESEKRAERRRKKASANPPAKRGRPRKSQ